MNPKLKTFLFFIIGAFAGITTMYLIKPPQSYDKNETVKTEQQQQKVGVNQKEIKNQFQKYQKSDVDSLSQAEEFAYKDKSIDDLTEEKLVIDYLKKHHKLPHYYIIKKEAKKQGWEPSSGNLCDVLPGRAIGGDKFSNREKKLPSRNGRIYYEADVNYDCGHRDADRLVYSNDGLIFLTHDHYKTFEQR